MNEAAAPHTALGAVLDRLEAEAPAPVARGRRALAEALAWTGTTDWREIAWSFSDLADGQPVELVWRPGTPGLFWTAEPAPPEWPAGRRLARAIALVRRIGRPFSRAELGLLGDLAASAPGPWPVWIAGRHRTGGDSAKIYLRLGGRVPIHAESRLAPALAALAEGDYPQMIGFEPGGACELYWRRGKDRPGDSYRLARLRGLGDAVCHLDRALTELTGSGLDGCGAGGEGGVGRRLGLSLKLSAAGHLSGIAAFMRIGVAASRALLRRRLFAAAGPNPALGRLWAEDRMRPMLLTLDATAEGARAALGFTLRAGAVSAPG